MPRKSLTAPPSDLDELLERYLCRDYAVVREFLLGAPDLIPLLLEASEKIPVYFGQNVRLVLEVSIDPEYPRDRELFVLVQTTDDLDKALSKRALFEKAWWLASSQQARGKIYVDVELV